MFDLIATFGSSMTLIPAAGLENLWETVRDDWLVWIFLGFVAVCALPMIRSKSWRELFGLVAVAVVVGLLLFAGQDLFGSEDATFTKVGKDAADEINSVVVDPGINLPGVK